MIYFDSVQAKHLNELFWAYEMCNTLFEPNLDNWNLMCNIPAIYRLIKRKKNPKLTNTDLVKLRLAFTKYSIHL